METQTLEIPVVWPDYFEDCEQCTERLREMLLNLSGMHEVIIHPDRRAIEVSYDKDLLTFDEIQERGRLLGVDVSDRYKHEVLRVVGLDCPDCANKLESAIRRMPGVAWASLNYATSVLTVEWEPALTSLNAVENKVRDFGYDTEHGGMPLAPSSKARARRNLRLLLTAASGILLAPALVIHFFGDPSAAVPLLLASAIIGGILTARSGFLSLRSLSLDTNLLVTVAALGAIALGEYAEAAAVVFLFSLGSLLEAYTVEKTRRSISSLVDAFPKSAHVKKDGIIDDIDLDRVEVGDIVVLKPGEKIPVDGTVTSGTSAVNEAPITGESVPRDKGLGDAVYAGSINGRGALEVRTTNTSEDNTLARIVQAVEEAQAQKAPSQRFSEKFGRIYTPCVIALAIATAALGPMVFGGATADWIKRALTLLVVSCPCALVISTPVAIVAAIGHAARSGILIKGGAHLEAMADVSIAAFDKTGTLTEGRLSICGIVPFNAHSQEQILAVAAAMETRSEHPLADAIVNYARESNTPELHVSFFEALPGRGARAVVDGEVFYIGSGAFMEERGIEVPGTSAMAELVTRGCSVIYLADSENLWGAIGAQDTLKENSAAAIARLKSAGISRTVMLTGDTVQSARAIASLLELDEEHSGLLPERKLALIRELAQNRGKVMMTGDGINDAPALAAADVGVAMGGAGSAAAIEAADVALMADDISMLPYAVALSRRTRRVIIQNISFALLVVIVLVTGAMTERVSLATGVLGHEGSALLVIANSMRLLKREG